MRIREIVSMERRRYPCGVSTSMRYLKSKSLMLDT
ncbi:hypothetical protein GQ600_4640 [Phytophthora cactorum]|nr:hypothetical protein GQ600_4640 [Phytophthora cactorum]